MIVLYARMYKCLERRELFPTVSVMLSSRPYIASYKPQMRSHLVRVLPMVSRFFG